MTPEVSEEMDRFIPWVKNGEEIISDMSKSRKKFRRKALLTVVGCLVIHTLLQINCIVLVNTRDLNPVAKYGNVLLFVALVMMNTHYCLKQVTKYWKAKHYIDMAQDAMRKVIFVSRCTFDRHYLELAVEDRDDPRLNAWAEGLTPEGKKRADAIYHRHDA